MKCTLPFPVKQLIGEAQASQASALSLRTLATVGNVRGGLWLSEVEAVAGTLLPEVPMSLSEHIEKPSCVVTTTKCLP